MSEISISRKEIEAKPILYIQRRVAQTQLQSLFAECFPKLFGHCIASGIAIGGQPIARYVEMTSGLWRVDCAIPLQNEVEPDGEMEFGHLQSGPVATAVHIGAYEGLPETNAAIQMWIEEHDYQVNGPPWESYVTSPTEYPDVKDWRTEIFWPLAE